MKNFYKQNEISEFLDTQQFYIPEKIKQIKIDVGLAGEAPNSAIWLSENDDRYVFGIEPLEHHWNMLTNFDTSNTTRPYPDNFKILQLFDETIKFKRETICSIKNRFTGIQCVIDNVPAVTTSLFYEMDRDLGKSGASSLLKPSVHHPSQLNDVLSIKTISLEMLLHKIPWHRFPFIEHLKTDCEGKDFDVVKSCGKYLQNIVFITSEMTDNTHHVIGACNPQEFIKFMNDNNFSVINHINGNINFINNRFIDTIKLYQLSNNTLGF